MQKENFSRLPYESLITKLQIKDEISLDNKTSSSGYGKIDAKSLSPIKVWVGDGGLKDVLIEEGDNKDYQVLSSKGMFITILVISQEIA